MYNRFRCPGIQQLYFILGRGQNVSALILLFTDVSVIDHPDGAW